VCRSDLVRGALFYGEKKHTRTRGPQSVFNVMQTLTKKSFRQLQEELINAIREGIARRGFYLALDGRASAIWANDGSKNPIHHERAITRFAQENGWRVDVQSEAVTFTRGPAGIFSIR
jgi:hypothetical protein